MKLTSALAILLIGGAALAADQTVNFKIDGWHSKGDAFKAEAALRAVKGVKSASADANKKELAITFDDAVVQQAALEKAVADAGYSVAH